MSAAPFEARTVKTGSVLALEGSFPPPSDICSSPMKVCKASPHWKPCNPETTWIDTLHIFLCVVGVPPCPSLVKIDDLSQGCLGVFLLSLKSSQRGWGHGASKGRLVAALKKYNMLSQAHYVE